MKKKFLSFSFILLIKCSIKLAQHNIDQSETVTVEKNCQRNCMILPAFGSRATRWNSMSRCYSAATQEGILRQARLGITSYTEYGMAFPSRVFQVRH